MMFNYIFWLYGKEYTRIHGKNRTQVYYLHVASSGKPPVRCASLRREIWNLLFFVEAIDTENYIQTIYICHYRLDSFQKGIWFIVLFRLDKLFFSQPNRLNYRWQRKINLTLYIAKDNSLISRPILHAAACQADVLLHEPGNDCFE